METLKECLEAFIEDGQSAYLAIADKHGIWDCETLLYKLHDSKEGRKQLEMTFHYLFVEAKIYEMHQGYWLFDGNFISNEQVEFRCCYG